MSHEEIIIKEKPRKRKSAHIDENLTFNGDVTIKDSHKFMKQFMTDPILDMIFRTSAFEAAMNRKISSVLNAKLEKVNMELNKINAEVSMIDSKLQIHDMRISERLKTYTDKIKEIISNNPVDYKTESKTSL